MKEKERKYWGLVKPEVTVSTGGLNKGARLQLESSGIRNAFTKISMFFTQNASLTAAPPLPKPRLKVATVAQLSALVMARL